MFNCSLFQGHKQSFPTVGFSCTLFLFTKMVRKLLTTVTIISSHSLKSDPCYFKKLGQNNQTKLWPWRSEIKLKLYKMQISSSAMSRICCSLEIPVAFIERITLPNPNPGFYVVESITHSSLY